MTLLAIVQTAADMVGLTRPASVYTSTDPAVRRMLALSNLGARELSRRHDWTALIREATWTTVATQSQGTLASIATDLDYQSGARIIGETIWDRTAQRRLAGPEDSRDWQRLTAANTSGPYSVYRIRANTLYLIPAPTAGHTAAFEYITKNWCQSSGGTAQTAWGADTDTALLSEHLLTLDLVWRFKMSNEMSWENDYQVFDRAVAQAIGHDGTSRTLNIGDDDRMPYGVGVPEGSWDL